MSQMPVVTLSDDHVSDAWAPIDRQLVRIGFFTPTSKRIRHLPAKSVPVRRAHTGQATAMMATIVPGALYGLPTTADQDKYLAFQILIRTGQRGGVLQNPVSFSSAALLHILGRADSGTHYREIARWLDVMTSTTATLEHHTSADGNRSRDRVHVFDRAVSAGQELEPGVIADRHYVWLSSWQLQRLQQRAWVSVPWDPYCGLRSLLARGLAPLTRLWAFAARHTRVSEKRYEDLCGLLSLRCYRHRSQILAKLGPALDELTRGGFLSGWRLTTPHTGLGFKLVLYHCAAPCGAQPHASVTRTAGRSRPPAAPLPPPSTGSTIAVDPSRLHQLTDLGVSDRVARQLLTALPPDYDLQAQIEWVDQLLTHTPGAIRNPAGLLVSLIRDRVSPPASFITSAMRYQREQEQATNRLARAERDRLLRSYADFREAEAARYLDALDPAQYARQLAEKEVVLRGQFRAATQWSADTLSSLARTALLMDALEHVPTISFAEFCAQQQTDDTIDTSSRPPP